MKEYTLCCDSGDLYAWMIINKSKHGWTIQSSRKEGKRFMVKGDTTVEVIIRPENKKAFKAKTKKLLDTTAGTPDYILYKGDEPICCVEDSKTAPVGNAVVQRLDKLFPLMLSADFRVQYIGPFSGLDVSQGDVRSWGQSWLYKGFAKDRQDLFCLIPPEDMHEDICLRALEAIEACFVDGADTTKAPITKKEVSELHQAAIKSLHTYDGKTFTGKLFKPNGTHAHPTQSTLMVLCEIHKYLGLPMPEVKFRTEENKQKFLTSRAKRLARTRQLLGV